MKTITLSNELIYKLMDLPESGMGYHKVNIILKDGTTSGPHVVRNCCQITLKEDFKSKDIKDIELIN